jgi:alpha-mannosidase/mannosylglycerate hydrolase
VCAASTFDVAERGVGRADDSRWRHPAPDTFIHQGFVAANGLTVAAPGLPEAEVAADGTIAITLLRAVGWLSRGTLRTRPQAAGPPVPTPGAQCAGLLHARLSLHPGLAVREALDAERGLCAVSAGDAPLLAPGHALLSLEPAGLLLSALKPADDGDGSVLRVLNPTDRALEAVVRLGLPVAGAEAVQLDETPCPGDVSLRGDVLGFAVPPRALRSVRLR